MYFRIMDISPLYQREVCDSYWEKLSEYRKQTAIKYKREQVRARSVGAGFLLEQILREEYHFSEQQIQTLAYGVEEYGKPYLKDYPSIHFNLSHSGDYVACAVDHKPIGVDIQEKEGYQEGIVRRFFSEKERERIGQETDEEKKAELFYRIWTGKESYSKLLGIGLIKPLDSYDVDLKNCQVVDGEQSFALSYPWENEKYICCICQ